MIITRKSEGVRVLCKFFMHGACLKGEYCEFSHDWSDQANNVCTFYQKGACSYGSRCRYDHVKVSRNPTVPPPRPTSSTSRRASTSLQLSSYNHPPHMVHQTDSSNQRHQISVDVLAHSASKPAWRNDFQHDIVSDDGIDWSSNQNLINQTSLKPVDLPICSFAAAGNCPYGEGCPQMHGDLCATCGKLCLHPYRPDEREEHIKLCEKNHKRLVALKRSQEIECSVCLDRVLSKPTAAERKFGLLSECDHPFCIECIRNWRSNSPASGMDVNSALRACPICRKLSYYVIPSVLWYFSKEEKEEITESYKSKLKSIDCKYFDFGTGSCPFGTSCFYKHAYRDGRLEEVILRHLDADDGSTVIAKSIRLSDFLGRMDL
ncbi:E3 ubiquitin-protein ligase makorin [Zea mays]|uniref:E3 ubiquitin-protein ligase makorin n=5 Tax=Zea mays TaxID=4577 RepID=A0A1D6NZP3_MAIZE|nr:E3 ubiquitin-protein ligase makorin [Zea mays]AQL03367.1 E3 ubiquitin-protein ligase makorin [Zea mays]AQL03368.1 E3 ubiquitin-protein ligase makorin [Zea mays]AQL03370.1 E3 ubiquitin-protein ligase makorin [Zea mays]